MTYAEAQEALPKVKRENLLRAMAIIGTHPSETDVALKGQCIIVDQVQLELWNPDDLEVASVLMVSKELGFALSAIGHTIDDLRALQKPWITLGRAFVSEAT